jgi:fructoselysine 3-epimerase
MAAARRITMKLSLDSVSYAGYFTSGESLPLEEVLKKAATFGFDAIDIFPHRPMAFPMDISKDRRRRLVEMSQSLNVELAVVEACTNFMMTDHILTQTQAKELLFVRECCELARDLGIGIVRILAAFVGYFMHEGYALGYGTTAMHSRWIDVSTNEDYLRQWEFVREGIREAGLIAKEYGVTLALQNHPPITNNTEETIEMVEEVGLDNVKIGLDLPLFPRQDGEYVRSVVHKVGKRMVHSHCLGIRSKESLAGPYGFDEVIPGEGPENWSAFLKACHEIGYDGYLAYEQCSPVFLKGHKRATLAEIDRRNQVGLDYMKNLLIELGLYTGRKANTATSA